MAAQMRAMQELQTRQYSATSTYAPIPTDVSLKTVEDTKSKGGSGGGGSGGGGGGEPISNATKLRHGQLMWKDPHWCKHRKKDHVFHFEKDCHTLPANKNKKAKQEKNE